MARMPSDRDSAGSIRVTAWPAIASVPASGVSAPVMILISVDLPAPFSPTSAWTSPAASVKVTRVSARTPANDFVMESASRRRGNGADDNRSDVAQGLQPCDPPNASQNKQGGAEERLLGSTRRAS